MHWFANVWNFALSGEPSMSKTCLAWASLAKSSPCVPLRMSKVTVSPGASLTPPAGSGWPFMVHVGLPFRTSPEMWVPTTGGAVNTSPATSS